MDIYLDNAATTRPDPAVLKVMAECAERCYGNAASWHRPGVEAAKAVERARQTLAEALGGEPDAVVFTSGGTEANNLAIEGAVRARRGKGAHLVTTAVEHPSVLEPCRALERSGVRVSVVGVDRQGFVDPDAVGRAITPATALVSVMHANNEIGTVEPIDEIGRLCRKKGVLFHCDACQSFTKEPLDLRRLRADLLSVNGHKIHGPKGVGALYVRPGTVLAPLIHGGGQERGLRSGTLNTPAIAGFGAAAALARPGEAAGMRRLRDRLFAALSEAIPGLRLNGPRRGRLCSNLHLLLPSGRAKPFLQALSAAGVYASAGSACSSAKPEPSHVLLAIGLTPEEASRCVRLSLSRRTTLAEVDAAARLMASLAGAGRAA
jgi:cysteine desulfurase